jgi:hypothetical protein
VNEEGTDARSEGGFSESKETKSTKTESTGTAQRLKAQTGKHGQEEHRRKKAQKRKSSGVRRQKYMKNCWQKEHMDVRRARTKLILGTILVVVVLTGLLCMAYTLVAHRDWTGQVPIDPNGSVTVVMCPACKNTLHEIILGGDDVRCAFYNVGEETGAVLASVRAKVVIDDKTNAAYGEPVKGAGLMHHKFCVIDEQIVTSGSYNPTDGGERSRNNLVIIDSPTLARNYREAFSSLSKGERATAQEPVVYLGVDEEGKGSIRIENAFCPRDGCEKRVVAVIDAAQERIEFMLFSFTSDAVGEALVRAKERGVLVEGFCDGGQSRSEREYNECARVGATLWEERGLVHHKVFIIDARIVVTGSYNPTAAGTSRNDENILIVTDETFAQSFLEEYRLLRTLSGSY